MTDDFEDLMSSQFDPEVFSDDNSLVEHGVLPASVDDHSALHLLEAEVQMTAMLYAQSFVGEYAAEDCPELGRCLVIGLNAYMHEVLGELPEQGSPADIEWMAWVRLAAGQAALGLEAFLVAHELEKVTLMVHLSNHGWYPFSITPGERGLGSSL